MKTVLISGGKIDLDFALRFIKEVNPDCLIGIDRGLNFCYQQGLVPNYIVGDFDSIDQEVISFYRNRTQIPIREFRPEKDATDTQIALELACEIGSTDIFILGATGGRLDHFWGNVQSMAIPAKKNIRTVMADSQNWITLLTEGICIRKEEQYGKYVSFFPLGDCVEGLTLKGFKYPLTEHRLVNTDGLTVSNEIVEDTANIKFRQGLLLMIMSNDGE